MSSKSFLTVGLLCLITTGILASLAFTGTLTWGYHRAAMYVSFLGGRAQSILSGRRLIETNNGALAIPVLPLFFTSLIYIRAAIKGKSENNTNDFLKVSWACVLISFPVYGIVIVNLLYDAGIQGVARPLVVMWLPLIFTLFYYGMTYWEKKGHIH